MADFNKLESQHRAEKLLDRLSLDNKNLNLVEGWTNHVWLSDTHAVRISSGRFRESFRHENDVLAMIGSSLPVPQVVEYGVQDGLEYLILERVPGLPLISAWPTMLMPERREAISQLASCLRSLHCLDVPSGFANPWIDDSLKLPKKAADAYLVSPKNFAVVLNGLTALAEPDLLQASEAYFEENLNLFSNDQERLIHGDVHFNNMIWDGTSLTLIDFEVSTLAHPDRELQMLREFCNNPGAVYIGESKVGPSDVNQLLVWLEQDYPELFNTENHEQRHKVYDLMRQLLQLHHFPEGHPMDPRPRLTKILF